MEHSSLRCTEGGRRRHDARAPLVCSVLVGMAAFAMPVAHAVEIPTANPDLKVRWDNTIKYSVGMRLKEQSATLVADANQDDGNRNFDQWGLISNRFDLFSEFDLTYQNFGLRLTGAAWYDDVYNRSNDHDSPFTANSASVAFDRFTKDTERLHGRKAELLDYFVFGRTEIADALVSFRLGGHTLLYGESLFFGGNGIAGAQAPIDIVKLLSVPNTPFKELMRPVPQFSTQVQVNPTITLGGYYQFGWEKDRIPAAGSYFSGADILDEGAERFLLGPGFSLSRTSDVEAKNSGQGGVQLRIRPEDQDVEYGLYAANFHSKSPVVFLDFPRGTYGLVFPENIRTLGASATTTVHDINVGAEVSYRWNMPLINRAGGFPVPPGAVVDNDDDVLYAVGRTLHAQVSWIGLLHPTMLWEGGSFLGEVAFNRLMSVSKNPGAVDPNATDNAAAIRFVFAPAYYQVLNGLDVSVPIGVGYGLFGRSAMFNPGFGVDNGGDFSIGISGEYYKVWKFGLNYTHFFGEADNALTPPNSAAPFYSYKQNLADRDFISLTFQRTF